MMHKNYMKTVKRATVPVLTAAMIAAQTGTASANLSDYDANYTMTVDYIGEQNQEAANTQESTQSSADIKVVNQEKNAVKSVKEFTDYGTDIKGRWSESYIDTLVKKGGIKGYDDGTFRPKRSITIVELVSMVINGSGRKADVSKYPESVMQQGAELGLIDSNMRNRGNEAVRRDEMAYILVQGASLNGESKVKEKEVSIPDLGEAKAEYRDEIEVAYSKGLVAGNDEQGTYRPSAKTTREEVCVIINRLYGYAERVEVEDRTGKQGHWKNEDFVVGNETEWDKQIDPNQYIDSDGVVFPKEGDIAFDGKPITRDPRTGVLGFGNGQHGGIYSNGTSENSSRSYVRPGREQPTIIKIGTFAQDFSGGGIRGMEGRYEKRGNYVYWTTEFEMITESARENVGKSTETLKKEGKDKYRHKDGKIYCDIYGNIYMGDDVKGEAFWEYDEKLDGFSSLY